MPAGCASPTGFTIAIPETPDGRHGDFAPAITLAFAHCKVDPESKLEPMPGQAVRTAEDHRKHWEAERAEDPCERAAVEACDNPPDPWEELGM